MAVQMGADLHEAENLAEVIELLKSEQGDSNATLGAKMGVSSTTIHRLLHGGKADDDTLDKIAEYAGLPRSWLYELAKGVSLRPRYSRVTMLIASLVEQMPSEVQEMFLAQARAVVDSRKKKTAKNDQQPNGLVEG